MFRIQTIAIQSLRPVILVSGESSISGRGLLQRNDTFFMKSSPIIDWESYIFTASMNMRLHLDSLGKLGKVSSTTSLRFFPIKAFIQTHPELSRRQHWALEHTHALRTCSRDPVPRLD